MRYYELMFIVNGDLQKEEVDKIVEKIKGIIEKENGEIFKLDEWGLKSFAYPIKKKRSGYYFLAYFKADYNTIQELERIFRITEDLYRYLIVKLDPRKIDFLKGEKQS